MVNIKFSTRYLVDLLFSRQITSSRRIRTNRKRLAISDSLPSDEEVLHINILERVSLTVLSGVWDRSRSAGPSPLGPRHYHPVNGVAETRRSAAALCR